MLSLFGPPRAPPYHYPSVKSQPHAFRLVKLLPPIRSLLGTYPHIEIITVDAACPFPYDTLSYCWDVRGGSRPDRLVVVETPDGPRELRIHRSLEVALLNLGASRPLFVDQICINQTDDEEKATQVKLMHDIYARCARVLVWLGAGTPNSDECFDCMKSICEESVLSLVSGPNCPHRDQFPHVSKAVMDPSVEVNALQQGFRDEILKLLSKYGEQFSLDGPIEVLRRPWFNRLWIIQEVCLAPEVIFACGTRSLCFDCFRTGLLFYNMYVQYWISNVQGVVPRSQVQKRLDFCALNKGLLRIVRERKAIHDAGQRQSLYDLVLKYNVNDGEPKIGATLAEDRLFAIMGLANPASLIQMRVRYGDQKSLFEEFATHLAAQNLSMILFSQFPKHVASLASWAPDWSMNLTIPCGYISLQEPAFYAGGAMSDPPLVDLESGRLTARCIVIGKITRVGKETIAKSTEAVLVDSIDYRSAKRLYDEIDEFLHESRNVKDMEKASVQLADFGLSYKYLSMSDWDSAIEKVKRLKNHVATFGQRLINTDKLTQSYRVSRIIGTLGVLPSHWVPASEMDMLQCWATDPVAAFQENIKVAGLFLLDTVKLLKISFTVLGNYKWLALKRRFAGMEFNGRDEAPLKTVGLDHELTRQKDTGEYIHHLFRMIGRRLYLTEDGSVGTGPEGIRPGDTVVVMRGVDVPVVLRTKSSDEFEYLGEAFCAGMMDGEALGQDEALLNIV